MRAPLEFTLTDAGGVARQYVVPFFPVDKGVHLVGRLAGILSGPLATVAGAAAAGISSGAKLSQVLEQELGGLDTEAVANQLRATFMGGAPAELVLDLVRPAVRDGKSMADPLERDSAYAGNYLELMQAAWKIAEGNGFTLQLSTLFTASGKSGSVTTRTTTSGTSASAG